MSIVEAATGAAALEPEEDSKDSSLADIVTFLPRWLATCVQSQVHGTIIDSTISMVQPSIHISVTAKIAHVQKSRDYAQTMPGLQPRNYAHYYASILSMSTSYVRMHIYIEDMRTKKALSERSVFS